MKETEVHTCDDFWLLQKLCCTVAMRSKSVPDSHSTNEFLVFRVPIHFHHAPVFAAFRELFIPVCLVNLAHTQCICRICGAGYLQISLIHRKEECVVGEPVSNNELCQMQFFLLCYFVFQISRISLKHTAVFMLLLAMPGYFNHH